MITVARVKPCLRRAFIYRLLPFTHSSNRILALSLLTASFRAVKVLLLRGADVDVLNKAGRRSTGKLASENGHVEVANFISDFKANPKILE